MTYKEFRHHLGLTTALATSWQTFLNVTNFSSVRSFKFDAEITTIISVLTLLMGQIYYFVEMLAR